jgi:CheY-like chemotaxis protein
MSRTILLADDSLTIQKVVELTFADTEYEVIAVSSGDELLQRLPETKPDLVICDVIMPGRDGYEVCQEIKSSSEYLHLPVILLTGTFEPFDRDRAIAVGCSEIITKPFEAKKLVDAVERLAASPGAPPPTAADTQSIAPEDLAGSDDEVEQEDTKVSHEYGPGDVVAEPVVDEDVAALQEDEPALEVTPVEPPAEETPDEFEFGTDDDGMEMESTDLPEVEEPPAVEDFQEPQPDPAMTLAAEDFNALAQTEEVEAISMEEEPEEEPFVEAEVEEEPFPSATEAPPPVETEVDNSLTTPIDVAAVMADRPADPEPVVADEIEEPSDESKDDADTQDFGDKPPVEESDNGGVGLSDEDVDRIARRLLELATDRIEHIAWDVIPDMAEVVVRERVRELEAEADREPS